MLVLAGGLAHLGERSGSWATSRPMWEVDAGTADGYVVWLEQRPVQADAVFFLNDVGLFYQHAPSSAWRLPGRAAYSFLVALLARLTASAGSVYAAFVVVTLLLWWGAALAVYDLGRRAGRSWALGVVAGTLVTSGMGFTFMVGNPMSNAAAYGALPIILWLLVRGEVFARGAQWTEGLLTACLGGALSLLYGLTPILLCFIGCYYVGRGDLRRILAWSAVALGVGVAWEVVRWDAGAAEVLLGGAAAAVFVGAFGHSRSTQRTWLRQLARLLPRVRALRAGLALGVGFLVLAFVLSADLLPTAVAAGLQIPHYLVPGLGARAGEVTSRFGGGWAIWTEAVRQGFFDVNVLAAFPWPVCAAAAVGAARLPRAWLEWSVAIIVAAWTVAFAMIVLSGSPHPRLVYFAYPGVYLLAANGLRNANGAVRALLTHCASRRLLPASLAYWAAAAVVLIGWLAIAAPSHASLWGEQSYHYRFHFGNLTSAHAP